MKLRLLVVALLLVLVAPAHAHVGSKDVFETVNVGPYKLFVTIRMPSVIPGVASIEVRSTGAPIDELRITPMPLTGEASKHPPTPDAMQRSATDAGFYTGSLWLMASGSWQVRFEIAGAAGAATTSVPVASAPLTVLRMDRSLGIILGALGLVLTLGFAGIVGAAVREAGLKPGEGLSPANRRMGMAATVAALVFIIGAVIASNHWWNVEAADYAENIYHPYELRTSLSGSALTLSLHADPRDVDPKKPEPKPVAMEDLLLDHGKVMHLYAIREPEMDAVFHLHPAASGKRELSLTLPAMPPGEYRLYADVVLRNGFPETLTSTLTVPAGSSAAPLAADDASAMPQGLSKGELGSSYKLPDGYTMVWDKPAQLTASTAMLFRFELLDGAGQPAADAEPYLGMAGHAAFVKTDGTVFAHTHPDGSAAMPALMMANGESSGAPAASDTSVMEGMPGMAHSSAPISPVVEFPYGFPTAGRYRIFIQMKHGSVVETGVFDAEVK